MARTTHQLIVRQSRETSERELVLARWDPVPYFTKDHKDIKGPVDYQRPFGDDHQGSNVLWGLDVFIHS